MVYLCATFELLFDTLTYQIGKNMILVIRKFTVRNGMEEAVRQAFVDRPHLVDSAPGYQRMEVLRALGHPE